MVGVPTAPRAEGLGAGPPRSPRPARARRRLLAGVVACALPLGAAPGAAPAQTDPDRAECAANEPDRAIPGCTRVLERGGGAEAAANRAAAFASRGNAHLRKGDLDQAVADYDQAIRLAPRSPDVLTNRGVAHARRGDLDRAIADLDQAVALGPPSADVLGGRGLLRERRGDPNGALADFDQALRLSPGDRRATEGQARVRGALAAARPAPSPAPPPPAAAPVGGAWAECASVEPDRSIAACTLLLERGGAEGAANRATALGNRGNAHAEKGDLDRAIADYDEAVRLNPRHASALFGRGVAHARKGDLDRAIADLGEAIRFDPRDADAFGHRGLVRARRGDLSGALADLQRALQLRPGDRRASDALSRVQAALAEGAAGPRKREEGEGHRAAPVESAPAPAQQGRPKQQAPEQQRACQPSPTPLQRSGVIGRDQRRGRHRVVVENRGGEWAVFKLRDERRRVAVSGSVGPHSTVTVPSFPNGRYRLEFAFGKEWSKNCRTFLQDLRARRFPNFDEFRPPERISEDRVMAQKAVYVIAGAIQGNVHAEPVDPAEFSEDPK